jgi:hypothetical protein
MKKGATKKGVTKQRSKKGNNKTREQQSKGPPIFFLKHSSAKQKLGPIYIEECERKASGCFRIMALPKALTQSITKN